MAKARSKLPPRELTTILDFIRYAATHFIEAKLGFGQGTDDPFEEAIFLVAEALHLPIGRIDSFLPARLTEPERRRVFTLIDTRIRTRTPAAYLLNRAYLQGVPFYVDKRVIVPRSYIAELLYSEAFQGEEPLIDRGAVNRALDLCTGSGCLAVLACDVFANAEVDAVDISKDALAVAEINVAEHGLRDRLTLYRGDLFKPLGETVYDIIISNPPYVTSRAVKELPKEFSYEPHLALEGGKDGMEVVRRILADASKHLAPDGGLLCEIGRGRAIIERDYPETEFLWLDTQASEGEVFWVTAESLREGGARRLGPA